MGIPEKLKNSSRTVVTADAVYPPGGIGNGSPKPREAPKAKAPVAPKQAAASKAKATPKKSSTVGAKPKSSGKKGGA